MSPTHELLEAVSEAMARVAVVEVSRPVGELCALAYGEQPCHGTKVMWLIHTDMGVEGGPAHGG